MYKNEAPKEGYVNSERQIPSKIEDWEQYHHSDPWVAGTISQSSIFEGICKELDFIRLLNA